MKPSDFSIVLNGLETVARAFIRVNGKEIDKYWKNSSIRTISKSVVSSSEEVISSVIASSGKGNPALGVANEIKERSFMVAESIKQYSAFLVKQRNLVADPKSSSDFDIENPLSQDAESIISSSNFNKNIYADNLSQTNEVLNSAPKTVGDVHQVKENEFVKIEQIEPSITEIVHNVSNKETIESVILKDKSFTNINQQKFPRSQKIQKLSDRARERKVPSSRIGRFFSYGELAVGMGFGAVFETARRSLGLKSDKDTATNSLLSESPFLSEANANRIVDTLCKVRGAALKLGQMLSIQDNAMINPQLAAVFERVRQSADYMPFWQMEKVLKEELGPEWRNFFSEFDPKPFAAASIGQVHCAKLLDGTEVALKIQYPGVAKGIESDIDNLKKIVNVFKIIPKGMYFENVMAVAERELKKEVDYVYEASSGKRFKQLLEQYPQFLVPKVYDDLCTSNVLTTELVYGTPIDKLEDRSQEVRNEVCKQLLLLCLSEIFLFRFMQTDPNWANFLYNDDTKQIVLLDFGACNEYTPEFVDTYMKIIKGAADQDRESVLRFSQELGFLTGFETPMMVEAHIDAVMILGEAFASCEPFNFKSQDMTHRIHNLVPIMLKHRLTAPPDETYSLHRKMSGIFLLCTKLGAVIDCRTLFEDVYEQYCSNKKQMVL